jgi:hypothetical protein
MGVSFKFKGLRCFPGPTSKVWSGGFPTKNFSHPEIPIFSIEKKMRHHEESINVGKHAQNR